MHRRPQVPNRRPVVKVTPPRVVRPGHRKHLPARHERGGR